MDLILWRHADAEDGMPDEARKLTAKGEKQARRVAKWLARRLPEETRILVSPAKRAQQTARALSKNFETCAEVGTTTMPVALLKAAGWPDQDGAVLVVGHQPVIGHTLSILSRRGQRLGGQEGCGVVAGKPRQRRGCRARGNGAGSCVMRRRAPQG